MSVTAAFLDSKRPCTVDPIVEVISKYARMLPTTVTPFIMVAADPTTQVTWLALPSPSSKTTWLVLAKRIEEPIWNVQTALGSPWPSSVSTPFSAAAAANL
jgi:hypothetical protein